MNASEFEIEARRVIAGWQEQLADIARQEQVDAARIIEWYRDLDQPGCRERLHEISVAYRPVKEAIMREIADIAVLMPLPPVFIPVVPTRERI